MSPFYRWGNNNVSLPILALFIDQIEKKVPKAYCTINLLKHLLNNIIIDVPKMQSGSSKTVSLSTPNKSPIESILLGANVSLVNLIQE